MLTTTAIGLVLVLVALGGLALIAYRNGTKREDSDDHDDSDSHSTPN